MPVFRKLLERGLLTLGVLLLIIYGAARAFQYTSSQHDLDQFDKELTAQASDFQAKVLEVGDDSDLSLWSQSRIEGYREALSSQVGKPLAVLSISRLKLRVPVFEGTDEPVLNRGVGFIVGTARPGQEGNIGIAGHRDGFFRTLKDIGVGDLVELTTLDDRRIYAVDEIEIVYPSEVRVLEPRKKPSITLVTCYPFYYNGSAPQRYIVHASLQGSED